MQQWQYCEVLLTIYPARYTHVTGIVYLIFYTAKGPQHRTLHELQEPIRNPYDPDGLSLANLSTDQKERLLAETVDTLVDDMEKHGQIACAQLGLQGWEMIYIVRDMSDLKEPVRFYFKRPYQADSEPSSATGLVARDRDKML